MRCPYTHIHICMQVHIGTYTHTRARACTRVHTHTHTMKFYAAMKNKVILFCRKMDRTKQKPARLTKLKDHVFSVM